MPTTTIVNIGQNGGDKRWDEKLDMVDGGARVIARRLCRMFITGDGLFKV